MLTVIVCRSVDTHCDVERWLLNKNVPFLNLNSGYIYVYFVFTVHV